MLQRAIGAIVELALTSAAFLVVALIAILITSADRQPSFAQGENSPAIENIPDRPKMVETLKVRPDGTVIWPNASKLKGDKAEADGTASKAISVVGKSTVYLAPRCRNLLP